MLKRILGAASLVLLWGAAWAAAGRLIGIADPGRSLNALWLGPAIGLTPGLLAGAIFSVLVGIAARRRRVDELSIAEAVACGGVAGLLVGALPFAINQPTNSAPLWQVGLVVVGSMTLLGAALAAGSLALARWARSKVERQQDYY